MTHTLHSDNLAWDAYFKKHEVKTVKKVVVINETQKKVWRLEAQNEMLRKELEDSNRIAKDYSDESFGYEQGYKRLKEEVKELKEENNHFVQETARLGELESIAWEDFYGEKEVIDDIKAYKFRDDIIAMKKENKELEREGRWVVEGQREMNAENKELKEEKNKYFGYLKDKDLECEEQRERAEALTAEIEKLKAEIESIEDSEPESRYTGDELEEMCKVMDDIELHPNYEEYEEAITEFEDEIKHLRKSKKEFAETIMELKHPVTNYDERCGVVKVRSNYSYLAGFMCCHDIDTYESRSVDEQEEYDGVIEHMSKEVENVIDTYLQDSLIYGTHMTLHEVIKDRLCNIIEQALTDGIIKQIDDSSDDDSSDDDE